MDESRTADKFLYSVNMVQMARGFLNPHRFALIQSVIEFIPVLVGRWILSEVPLDPEMGNR